MFEFIAIFFLSLLGDKEALVFLQIDWKRTEKIVNSIKRRGRPDVYPRVLKSKILMWGYIHNQRGPTGMVRILERNLLARIVCGVRKIPSHDCLTDAICSFEPALEQVFEMMRDDGIRKGIVRTEVQAEDTTSVATKFKKDRDGKWSLKRKAKKKGERNEYYFGYGQNARFDVFSHLAISLLFIQSKKTDTEEIKELYSKTPYKPDIYLADSEFDIEDLHEWLMRDGTLPIIEYNPRNTKEPLKIKYRIEAYSGRLGRVGLKKIFGNRAESEHGWSTMKERFGLEDIHVKGWKKVKAHAFLCHIHRYADAFAVHKYHPEASVRSCFLSL